MNTPAYRTAQTLAGVQPEVAMRVARVLERLATSGHQCVAYSGRRTLQQQQILYAQGRTRPGPIVTNCDGIKRVSPHQDGRAVDCAWWERRGDDAWVLVWDGPWGLYGELAEEEGLTWGGRFKDSKGRPWPDRPHVEWRGGA